MEGTLDNLTAPAAREANEDGSDEPRGELEQEIARIWSEVFHLERVGRDDNFFALGGNSLLGMDLTEALADRLSIRVPVLVLFQYPSVRELAEIITENQ